MKKGLFMRTIYVLLIIIFTVGCDESASALKFNVPMNSDSVDISVQLDTTLDYLINAYPQPSYGISGGEWTVITLAKAGRLVPDGYFEGYYDNIVSMLETKGTAKLDGVKSTENSRLIIALSAIGKDPANIGGYDLIVPLADFEWVIKQGINGPVFALIALDSGNYELPQNTGFANETTRQKMIDFILDKEVGKDTSNAGGFALTGSIADPDVTAIVLQALAPYRFEPPVAAVVERAVTALSNIQNSDGGFTSLGSANSASNAQIIVALTALDIDPAVDNRFIKNDKNPITALLEFYVEGGGFKHISSQDKINGMATDQSAYALVVYDKFVKKLN